jgi:hypothetical protein
MPADIILDQRCDAKSSLKPVSFQHTNDVRLYATARICRIIRLTGRLNSAGTLQTVKANINDM